MTAVFLSVFINRCAKERATEIVGGMDEEERNQEDVDAFRKNEEEWLMQTPLDDELGKKISFWQTLRRMFDVRFW